MQGSGSYKKTRYCMFRGLWFKTNSNNCIYQVTSRSSFHLVILCVNPHGQMWSWRHLLYQELSQRWLCRLLQVCLVRLWTRFVIAIMLQACMMQSRRSNWRQSLKMSGPSQDDWSKGVRKWATRRLLSHLVLRLMWSHHNRVSNYSYAFQTTCYPI